MDMSNMLRALLQSLPDDNGGADAVAALPPAFTSFDVDGVAKKIAEANNIIVMAGAGEC